MMEDIERAKKRIAENRVSLNEQARRAELNEDKARKEAREKERAKLKTSEEKVFAVTLDNVAKPQLELKEEKDKEKDKKGGFLSSVVGSPTTLAFSGRPLPFG